MAIIIGGKPNHVLGRVDNGHRALHCAFDGVQPWFLSKDGRSTHYWTPWVRGLLEVRLVEALDARWNTELVGFTNEWTQHR
jgi:hypothetical protein